MKRIRCLPIALAVFVGVVGGGCSSHSQTLDESMGVTPESGLNNGPFGHMDLGDDKSWTAEAEYDPVCQMNSEGKQVVVGYTLKPKRLTVHRERGSLVGDENERRFYGMFNFGAGIIWQVPADKVNVNQYQSNTNSGRPAPQ